MAKTIKEIKSLEIQGATNITRAALKALLLLSEDEIPRAIKQLLQVRPTESLLQNCLTLVKLKGKSVIKPTLARLENVREDIIKNGLSLIRERSTILTHCHSSTVVELLKRAKKKKVNFKVYLTETRPAFQGRITAQELVAVGISSTMITDSTAPFLISRHDKREIDFVLFGADAIISDGAVINKVGSYGIALSAYEAKIPFYILASLLKFSPQEVVIEERGGEEIWKEKPKDLEIINPAFDLVPAKMITGLVTEFGIIKPERVKNVVREDYPWIMGKRKNRGCGRGSNPSQNSSPHFSYLHLGERVNWEKNIIADFVLTTEGDSDFLEIAGGVAAESSVGTWTEVTTQSKSVWKNLHARILEADEETGFLKIAYPLELFEPGNLSQLLSSVAGNIFGLGKVKNLKLLDLAFPEKYIKSFPGPVFGSQGVRELTGILDRPLIGCIIKPKLGLDSRTHAQVAKEVFEGGVDFVKDDENLTSQIFNSFENRVREVTKRCYHVLKRDNKIYAFNVTASSEVMEQRARFVKNHGGNCVMIDFLTSGFAGLQMLRNKNFGLIIHGHRAMHAAFNRIPNHGISMMVLTKLARLAGVDSLHSGTVVGKMEGEKSEILKINRFLLSEWYGIKPVLPVASGGLHPGLIPELIKILGNEVLLNFGGGIHGHPKGSKEGAKACLAALRAVKKGIPLLKYAKSYEELRLALDLWGSKTPL